MTQELQLLTKKLKTQREIKRRWRKKATDLRSVVKSLQDENLISTRCADLLETTLSGVPKTIMARIVKGKSSGAYPPELRSFAMTLQFYSSRAYNYVRETLKLALPHPRQIRSWYNGVNGDPGFTKAAFSAIEARATDNKAQGKETICAVMLDEMAIRRHVQYAKGRYHGYVDVGSGQFSDTTPLAKDALVMMAVSVNAGWKIPLGYFLIDGMSGEERANLVSECFHKLHEAGVRAVSLTCDGPSCHFSMMRHLGVNMTVTVQDHSFPHPADPSLKVYVVLDVCHMLKLLRNALSDIRFLRTQDGRIVSWKYIEELNKLQEDEGLRLGNKLKSAHIKWKRQIMKVSLAAQVFSTSVADAIQYCNEGLKLPQFRGCEATVQFIRHVDSTFDVLNSRNPLGKGFKAPMRKTNNERTQKILAESREFLLGLKSNDGNFMHLGSRRVGFVGFVVSIDSIVKVFEELVDAPNAPLSYVLTYKFSQDHLELFFAAVRSHGGFNNNPTALQFMSSYKRLLMRHDIHNGDGNCTIIDNTKILQVSNVTQSAVSIARKYDMLTREPISNDHDYADIPNFESLSLYKEAAVNYIAGYVVRMTKKKLQCMPCIRSLERHDGGSHNFLIMKDNGGLVKPSSSVVSVCMETEKCFQRMIKTSNGKLPLGPGISDAISTAVLHKSADLTWFKELHSHQFETAVGDNHIHNLVKIVSMCYNRIRLFHLGKQENEAVAGERVRKRLSKLVLFKHQ